MAKLPTEKELRTLDEYKVVAYATRSAMRAFAFWEGNDKHTGAVKRAIQIGVEKAGGKKASVSMSEIGRVADAIRGAGAVRGANAARAVDAVLRVVDLFRSHLFTAIAVDAANYSAYAAHSANHYTAHSATQHAVTAAARTDFERLKTLPNGPLNCGPRGPLGPVWHDWKPEGWDETGLDFVYENMVLEEEAQPKIRITFDDSGFTKEEMARCLQFVSECYSDAGGNGLKVIDGNILVPERVTA